MSDDWKRRIDRMRDALEREGDPVAWVRETDAARASALYPGVAVRGAVFGVAVERERGWEVVVEMRGATPQEARDGLHSILWFRAKDDTDDPAVRRDLLAAVAIMERESVDEVRVRGERYRVVRGDEFARCGDDGLEPPRATDPEPVDPGWEEKHTAASPDEGFVLDPVREEGLMDEVLKLGMREFVYSGERFPAAVRDDSLRAVASHADIALLPVVFGIAERRGEGWRPRGGLMPTPHDARRLLYDGMTSTWPLLYEFDDEKRERYRLAGERFRAAGRADEARVDDRIFRICRISRLVRFGPDGPEPPRPSDVDDYGPMKMHPTMDEDGTVHYATEG
ncbi:DUF5954 family protein [Streptomyces sp. NPDC008121]|uniref:DUF5954 family protein n=1 Tax=Streptomyces sp. NPDC008121 TaxID=3364809 RepID=UPI0036E206F6